MEHQIYDLLSDSTEVARSIDSHRVLRHIDGSPKNEDLMTPLDRRAFLKSTILGPLSLTTFANVASRPGALPRRPLGSTGLEVSLLGLGCATIGYSGQSIEEGAEVVEACIDGGVTYIDCASSYGNAEEKVGHVMKRRRTEVVLATKTLERDKEEAWREINRSLERLQTDRVDLLQVHAVNAKGDLDRVFDDNGSLAAVIRAKEEGMCSHIGITGHTRPGVIAEALRRFPFATVLAPLSSTDALVNDFGPVIFPLAKERRFGVIAMKVLAAGRVTGHPADSIRYALSLPVSTAILGMGSRAEVEDDLRSVRSFTPMDAEQMHALEERTRTRANTGVMWWKRY